MNLKPALTILLVVFVMAKLIVETEQFLFGERIQSEKEIKGLMPDSLI